MEVTREWLDGIGDGRGLTPGQVKVLNVQCGGAPYVGKLISDQAAAFLVGCRGYRALPDELKGWIGDRPTAN